MTRLALLGNSGSGKSTCARRLSERHDVPMLELDLVVWEPEQIGVLRDPAIVRADIAHFLAAHTRWIVEGCYGELIASVLPHCGVLYFLNPGRDACLANNRRRPWEPQKYASAAAQDAMLESLQAWVAGYYLRDDQCSLAHHRKLFDSYPGRKRELRTAQEISDALETEDCAPAPSS